MTEQLPPNNSVPIPSLAEPSIPSFTSIVPHSTNPVSEIPTTTEAANPSSSSPPSPSSLPSSSPAPSPAPSPSPSPPVPVESTVPSSSAAESPLPPPIESPVVSSGAAGTTVTVTPTTSRITVIVTNTSFPLETTLPSTIVSTGSSATAATSEPQDANNGLGLTKTVVAIAVPLLSVALIIVGLIIWWSKRKNAKRAGTGDDAGPDYEYAVGSKAMRTGSASDHSDDPYENTSSDEGYRGWGSTGGGRKTAAIPLSSVSKSNSDGGHGSNDNYVTVSNSAYPGSPPNLGNTSPTGTNSSTVGVLPSAVTGPNDGGLNRGISNASSNYSAMSTSDRSVQGNRDSRYHGMDGNHDDYSITGNPYAYETQKQPIIQDVQARRHTRIETPTSMHHPQQGNSGIAQNF